MTRYLAVICPECAAKVEHHCDHSIKKELVDLYAWTPEYVHPDVYKAIVKAGRADGWLEKDEEPKGRPFFGSQGWSYAMFSSKDTARSFHAFIDSVVRAAGFDPHELKRLAEKRLTRENGNREKQDEKAKQLAAEAAFITDNRQPLDERKARFVAALRERARSMDATKLDGYLHLFKYVDKYLGGGLGDTLNHAIIAQLQDEAKRGGAVHVEFFDVLGIRLYHQGTASYEEALAIVEASGKYDPEHEDARRCATFLRVRGPEKDRDARFQRAKNGAWKAYERKISDAA
jgi:hypothetical protein